MTSHLPDLPKPKSSYIDRLKSGDGSTPTPAREPPRTPPGLVTSMSEPGNDSLGAVEADPWASPDLHRDHDHNRTDTSATGSNGLRTTANAWSGSEGPEGSNEAGESNRKNTAPGLESAWTNAGLDPSQQTLGFGEGFVPSGDAAGSRSTARQEFGEGRITSPRLAEEVTVALLPEKEGVFLFQHRNYEVKSPRRGSTVVRRYSDFVWLLDCLHKRYPFRQLPLLPPKRVAGTL